MAVAYEIVYTYIDADGDTATSAIDIPTTFSLAQYTEFGRAMAALVDDIVHGVVQSAELTVSIDISTLTNNGLVADSDVEEVGAFQFTTPDGRPVNINIPAIDETLVVSGTDALDLSAPAVAAFATAMTSGVAVTGGTAIPSDVDGQDLTALAYAREAHRSSGKRR